MSQTTRNKACNGLEQSSDVVREVVGRARSLAPTDDRVECIDGGEVTVDGPFSLNRLLISTMLFNANVADAHHLPAEWIGGSCERGEIHVRLEHHVRFTGYGDGMITFDITADPETHDIEAMTVSRTLSAQTQMALA